MILHHHHHHIVVMIHDPSRVHGRTPHYVNINPRRTHITLIHPHPYPHSCPRSFHFPTTGYCTIVVAVVVVVVVVVVAVPWQGQGQGQGNGSGYHHWKSIRSWLPHLPTDTVALLQIEFTLVGQGTWNKGVCVCVCVSVRTPLWVRVRVRVRVRMCG